MKEKTNRQHDSCLTVSLSDALDLVLLLNRVRVGGFLGAVGDLISEALRNGLDAAEGSEAGTSGDEPDGVVDAADGGDIDGLTTDGTGGADLTGVLTGATVLVGVDEDLDGVGVRVEESDDLQSLTDDTDSLQLLTVVASVHHEGAGHALDDGAQGLTKALNLVASGGVGSVDTLGLGKLAGADLDVIDQRDLVAEELGEIPLSEELRLNGSLERGSVEFSHLLGCRL